MSFYGWYENAETIFLAMEYFPLGDLSGYVRNINEEDEIVSIVRQLVSALNVSHKHNIVHRDLNPRVALSFPAPPLALIVPRTSSWQLLLLLGKSRSPISDPQSTSKRLVFTPRPVHQATWLLNTAIS